MLFLSNLFRDMVQDFATGRTSFGKMFAIPFMVVALGLGIGSGIQHIQKGQEVIDLIVAMAGVGITLSGVSKGLSIAGSKYSINSNSQGDASPAQKATPEPGGM